MIFVQLLIIDLFGILTEIKSSNYWLSLSVSLFKQNDAYKMNLKIVYILSILLCFVSCNVENKEPKIQFTANGEKYEVIGNDKTFMCEVKHEVFSNTKDIKSPYDDFKHNSISFIFINDFGKEELDEFVINFLFKMCSDELFPGYAKVTYEDFTCFDNTAGYKSVIKAKGKVSGRYTFLKGGGTNDKFHLDISVSNNLANGTFSGNITSDLDSNRLIIENGIFENIPFSRIAIDP